MVVEVGLGREVLEGLGGEHGVLALLALRLHLLILSIMDQVYNIIEWQSLTALESLLQ